MTSALDPEQRSRLLGHKLAALIDAFVTDHPDHAGMPDDRGGVASEGRSFAGGAGHVREDQVWVLLDASEVGLGAALAWAHQQGGRLAHLVVDGDAAPRVAALARQASYLADVPQVWRVDGRSLVAVDAGPVPAPVHAPDNALELVAPLRDAGLDVAIEHGVVTGEVLGLEVARVVIRDDGRAAIEVGVGRNDRELFGMMHGDLPTDEALRRVVDKVRLHRRADQPAHPLNRLAGERWLRSHLLTHPGRLDGWALEPIDGPVARLSLSDRLPAYAAGQDRDGGAVVLACSVGIDLEVVPAAADARAGHDPGARLVIAVPARDAHAVTHRAAAALRDPAEVLPIEGDWRV